MTSTSTNATLTTYSVPITSTGTSTIPNYYTTAIPATTITGAVNYTLQNTTATSGKVISINPSTTASVTFTLKDPNEFVDIVQYKKDQVYGFEFADGTKVKTILQEGDKFSLEYAFYLALAKKLYSKTYTFYGVLCIADDLQLKKYYVKLVNKGLKLFKKKQEEAAKLEKEEQEKKERYKRLIEKKKKRNIKHEQENIRDLTDIIAYAIKKSKEED